MQALLEALANAMGKRSGGYSANDDAETSLLREDDPRRRYYADAAMEGPIPTPRSRPAKANAGISKTTYDNQRGEKAAEAEVERAVEGKGPRYMKGGGDESDAESQNQGPMYTKGNGKRASNNDMHLPDPENVTDSGLMQLYEQGRFAPGAPGYRSPNAGESIRAANEMRGRVKAGEYGPDEYATGQPNDEDMLQMVSGEQAQRFRPMPPAPVADMENPSGPQGGDDLGDMVGQILERLNTPAPQGSMIMPATPQQGIGPTENGVFNAGLPTQVPPPTGMLPPSAAQPPITPMPGQPDILSQIKAAIAGGPQGAQAGSDLQKRIMDLITQGTNAVFPRN